MNLLHSNIAWNKLKNGIQNYMGALDQVELGAFDSINIAPLLENKKLAKADKRKLMKFAQAKGVNLKEAISEMHGLADEAKKKNITDPTIPIGGSMLDFVKYQYMGPHGGLDYINTAKALGSGAVVAGGVGLAGYGAYSAINDN